MKPCSVDSKDRAGQPLNLQQCCNKTTGAKLTTLVCWNPPHPPPGLCLWTLHGLGPPAQPQRQKTNNQFGFIVLLEVYSSPETEEHRRRAAGGGSVHVRWQERRERLRTAVRWNQTTAGEIWTQWPVSRAGRSANGASSWICFGATPPVNNMSATNSVSVQMWRTLGWGPSLIHGS